MYAFSLDQNVIFSVQRKYSAQLTVRDAIDLKSIHIGKRVYAFSLKDDRIFYAALI